MKLIAAIIALVVLIACFVNAIIGLSSEPRVPFLLTFPLMLVACAFLLFAYVFPAFIYRSGVGALAQSVVAVEGSGAALAQTACGGSIGHIGFTGPLIRASVHPDGLVVKPLLMPAVAVHVQEMTAITAENRRFHESVTIEHTSPNVASPIVLECGANDPVRSILLARYYSGSVA